MEGNGFWKVKDQSTLSKNKTETCLEVDKRQSYVGGTAGYHVYVGEKASTSQLCLEHPNVSSFFLFKKLFTILPTCLESFWFLFDFQLRPLQLIIKSGRAYSFNTLEGWKYQQLVRYTLIKWVRCLPRHELWQEGVLHLTRVSPNFFHCSFWFL